MCCGSRILKTCAWVYAGMLFEYCVLKSRKKGMSFIERRGHAVCIQIGTGVLLEDIAYNLGKYRGICKCQRNARIHNNPSLL